VIDIQKSGCTAGPGTAGNGDAVRAELGELIPVVGMKPAYAAINVPRASFSEEDIGGFARFARRPAAGCGALAGSGGTGEDAGAPA